MTRIFRWLLYAIAALIFILAAGYLNETYERARASWWADELNKAGVGRGE